MRGKCWLAITIEMRHHGVRIVHVCCDKYEDVESGLTAISFFHFLSLFFFLAKIDLKVLVLL